MKPLSTKPEITLHPAIRRQNYRNRVQLHYDLSKKKIGLKSAKFKKIIEIPDCKILNPKAEGELKSLYQQKKWLKLINKSQSSHPNQGHIEIYNKNEETSSIAINKPYAHLGFSQVFEEMNLKLRNFLTKKVTTLLEGIDENMVLDLFGGNGNLTRDLKSPVVVIVPPVADIKGGIVS